MPQRELSEIVVVLDKSGSMQSVRGDAIGGFNAFLGEQQAQPGCGRLTLALFDSPGTYELVHCGTPLAEVPLLTEETYVPSGMTALLDAIGRTVDEVGKRLAATPEPDRPESVIVAILTDGEENSSQEYSRERVFEMIRVQREAYSWQFVYLGANQDAIAEAGKLGISADDAAAFDQSEHGTADALLCASAMVSARRQSRPKA